MGGIAAITAGQWLLAGVAASTAVASNVAANRASNPVTKGSIKAPSSSLDKKVADEDDINLGSDRAKNKGKRSTGRRQLMAEQTAPSTTGLQI